MPQGALIISLDFELFWGMRDKRTIEGYGKNILGVRQALPRMLDAFDAHGVKATLATVGLLFFNRKEELIAALPEVKPSYTNKELSPYNGHIDGIGVDEASDPYHFGASLIRQVQQHPAHEIACHTFSHYYCLEHGQTEAEFAADLEAAQRIARAFGIDLKSFVFPRNQYNARYLKVCAEQGITSYRGNERSWLYDARNKEDESQFRRALRLLDTWFNLSGYNCHPWPAQSDALPLDLPSSRFLRPHVPRYAALDGLKLRRITKAMAHAAKTGTIFHLWWHPHNFGSDLEENIGMLEKILAHYDTLREKHGFQSLTMNQATQRVLNGNA
ncbi:MAG TPA: polysaccharide deacetylase family protein [Flavobacteriales bacterium]|nr:polysaccharide deacetylase family protein [Flavobacteriales bacterium]